MGNLNQKYFSIGEQFDAAIYNAKSPLLAQASIADILSAILYTSDSSDLLGTIVDGKWIVKNQMHLRSEKITAGFLSTLKRLQT
jgi:formimidoylglutamate deiminase